MLCPQGRPYTHGLIYTIKDSGYCHHFTGKKLRLREVTWLAPVTQPLAGGARKTGLPTIRCRISTVLRVHCCAREVRAENCSRNGGSGQRERLSQAEGTACAKAQTLGKRGGLEGTLLGVDGV